MTPKPLIDEALRLQPAVVMHVKRLVEKLNARQDVAVAQKRRFVRVAPPTVHAGIGNALRKAFQINAETRSISGFEDLLGRID